MDEPRASLITGICNPVLDIAVVTALARLLRALRECAGFTWAGIHANQETGGTLSVTIIGWPDPLSLLDCLTAGGVLKPVPSGPIMARQHFDESQETS